MSLDTDWLFGLIRDAERAAMRAGWTGDNYRLPDEIRKLALRLEAGDFSKARGMLSSSAADVTPGSSAIADEMDAAASAAQEYGGVISWRRVREWATCLRGG